MRTSIILIILSNIFLFSCGPSQEEINNQKKRELILGAYNDIFEYALKNYTDENRGHNTSGIVKGDAVFRFGKDYIKVNYTALQYEDTEIGDLEDLYFDDSCGFKDCSNIYNLSIRGRWNCRTSGDGDFNLTVSDSKVYFYIFGDGGWSHYLELLLPSTEYVINSLKNLNESINNLQKT